MSMYSIDKDFTEVKPDLQLDHRPDLSSLNQHEVTNRYRRLAAEFGAPACVEQQTVAEWLADYDRAEVCS